MGFNHVRTGEDKDRTRDRLEKLLVKILWLQIQSAHTAHMQGKLITLSVILYCQGRCLFMLHMACFRDLIAAVTTKMVKFGNLA